MAIIERSYAYSDCNPDWKPTWLVAPFLMENGVTIIHAEPKARKSTFRAHLIAACMAGDPVCGYWPITKRVWSTLVVIGEENRHAEATRIAEAMRALGREPSLELNGHEEGDHRLRIVPPISGVWLDDEAYIEAVAQEIDEHGVNLVVLDPLIGLHRGVENEADAMARVAGGIRRLAQSTSVLVIHHDAKQDAQSKRTSGDRMRGSSVLRGAYDIGVEIRSAGLYRELHFETRYAPPLEPQIVQVSYRDRATIWRYIGEKDLTLELREYLKSQGDSWISETRLELEVPHPISKIRHVLETMTLQGECVHRKENGKPPRWKLIASK